MTKGETSGSKLNTTHYLLQIRNILKELRLLLAPNKEHKKLLHNVPVAGCRNGKSPKDYLVRIVLPKTNETGRCEPCGKKI